MATSDEYASWIVKNADKKGTPEFDIVAKAYADSKGKQPAAVTVGKELNSIPRQFGLTARYGLEGLANSAELVTEPIRAITDRLTGNVGNTKPAGKLATQFADFVGLPSPQNADERVIADATKLGFGSMGMGGAANKFAKMTTGATADALKFLAANPAQQAATAAGAGLGGGASREAGGSQLEQGVAAVAGGLGGAAALSAGKSAANLAKQLFNKGLTQQQLDVQIGGILSRTGVDYNQVPEKVKQSLRAELASSLNANKELNADAVSRLAAFKEAGVTPTRGMISQNPVQITREMNLAKTGANSSDEGLQGLALMQNQNNAKLIGNMNNMGANLGDIEGAGQTVTNSIFGRQAGLRGAEQSAWDLAKSSPGYKQPISAGPLSDINRALDDEALMPFMNKEISKYMEAFQTGQPFTPQAYRNLQSMLSSEVAKGGNEARAAELAARILRDSELKPAGLLNTGNLPVPQGLANALSGADNAATEAIGAVNTARGATRSAYAFEDSSPLVRSVLSDSATSDPARIAQRYVIGGTATEAAEVVNQVGPQGLPVIKNAILAHLKDKALSGAADETGKFSQAAFNKALAAIGDRKLSLLFTPEELRMLQVNGRVAALMQSQPIGAAVNNSNSGALMLGRGYDGLRALAGKLPFGQQMVLDPLSNISASVMTKKAQNVLPGLLRETEKLPIYQPLLLPAALSGGLLAPQ